MATRATEYSQQRPFLQKVTGKKTATKKSEANEGFRNRRLRNQGPRPEKAQHSASRALPKHNVSEDMAGIRGNTFNVPMIESQNS